MEQFKKNVTGAFNMFSYITFRGLEGKSCGNKEPKKHLYNCSFKFSHVPFFSATFCHVFLFLFIASKQIDKIA
jgi:hypothetical protein